jgi:hypothetical protein
VGRVESTLALEENKAQNPGILGAKLSWVSERKRGIEKRFSRTVSATAFSHTPSGVDKRCFV